MTATWTATNLDYYTSLDDHTDVVYVVHWNCQDEDADGNTGRCYGTVGLSTDDLSSFTPYADITEEQAIGWAKDALGADEVAKIEADIAAQLAAWESPPTYSGVPWTI